MLLFDICPLVAAKVRFATQKAKKVHHSMHYFFRMVLNDVSNRRRNKGTVGSGRIEIHKKILIFGNVIQKITIRFGITFFFTIFAKNCENRLHPGKEQALCTRFTLSLQQITIKRMKSVKRGLQDTIMR